MKRAQGSYAVQKDRRLHTLTVVSENSTKYNRTKEIAKRKKKKPEEVHRINEFSLQILQAKHPNGTKLEKGNKNTWNQSCVRKECILLQYYYKNNIFYE